MVTNACYNLVNGGAIMKNVANYHGDIRSAYNNLLSTCFGGLMLFENNIMEDANTIIMPFGNKNIAIASDVYSGSNINRGTLNANESKEINDGKGYRYVWDFGTDRANGIIRCACLTSRFGGYNGYLENDSNSCGSGFSYSAGNSYTRNALSQYNGGSIYVPDYSFSYENYDLVGNFEKDRYVFAKCNLKAQSISFSIVSYLNTAGLTSNFKTNVVTKEVTTTKPLTASNFIQQVDDKLYSILPYDTNKIDVVIFDGKTLEIESENTYEIQDADFYTNITAKYFYTKSIYWNGYFVIKSKDSKNVYFINASDLADYSVYPLECYSHQLVVIGGLLYFVPTSYNNIPRTEDVYLFEGTSFIKQHWKLSGNGSGSFCLNFIPSPFVKSPHILLGAWDNSESKHFGVLNVFPMFLSTINNLSTPVVKNETQTMKVTYEITEI